MTPWDVRVSPVARQSLLALPDTAFGRVSDTIELLRSTPLLGREYRPSYEAARLPFPCRVIYVGYYGLYYTADEETHGLYLRFIEDQRMDPKRCFTERLG